MTGLSSPHNPCQAELDFQLADDVEEDYLSAIPAYKDVVHWVDLALAQACDSIGPQQLTVRIVSQEEISHLNQTYRHKLGPTNVLSFPADIPHELGISLLGDIVICAAVVCREAREQNKPLYHHWTHMVVHGVLHLLGYDHVNSEEAMRMEALEKDILSRVEIPDPYIESEECHERH